MVVKFEWAYCWLDQSPTVSEMKAPPQKWTISVLSTGSFGEAND